MNKNDDLSDISISQPLSRLMAYWREKCGDRAMPSRADIEPLDFRYILGDVALVDVLPPTVQDAPHSFRFRLYGSNLARRLGADLTGKEPSDHPDPVLTELMNQTYSRAVKTRAPIFHRRSQMGVTGQIFSYIVLILPLSGSGENVDTLLIALDFDA